MDALALKSCLRSFAWFDNVANRIHGKFSYGLRASRRPFTFTLKLRNVSMLKSLAIATVLTLAGLLASTPADAQRRQARDVFYVSSSSANVRSGPSTSARIIGRLDYCQPVPVVRQMPGTSWYVVNLGGRRGFMSSTVISPFPPPGCGRRRRG